MALRARSGASRGFVLITGVLIAEAFALVLALRFAPADDCWVWSPEDTWCRAYPWLAVASFAVLAPAAGWAAVRVLRPPAIVLSWWLALLVSAIGFIWMRWLS